MATKDPISELFEQVTSFVPAEVNEMGEEAFEERLLDTYSQFERYFLSSLPLDIDVDEYMAELPDDPCAQPIPVAEFADTLTQAAELLRTIGGTPALVSPRTPADSLSDPSRLSDLKQRVSIDDLPFDMLSERQKSAVMACREFMFSASNLIWTLKDLIDEINEELNSPEFEEMGGEEMEVLEESTTIVGHEQSKGESHKPRPIYFDEVSYDENELRRICSALKTWAWLNDETDEDDFVFFFTGVGEVPCRPLLWDKGNVRLSLLLSVLTKDSSPWKKAEGIFLIRDKNDVDKYESAKASSLRVTYSQTIGSDKYLKKLDEVKRVIGLK